MGKSVFITLKTGRHIRIEEFDHITYPGNNGHVSISTFDDFYLYDRLLTFVGKTKIVTLKSVDIESIQFDGEFKE